MPAPARTSPTRSHMSWRTSGRREVSGDIGGDACPKHQPFEEGVAGQSIGSVDAGGGHLPDRPETFKRSPPVGIGVYATHVVMGSRRNGQESGPRVEAGGQADGKDGWEAGWQGVNVSGGGESPRGR